MNNDLWNAAGLDWIRFNQVYLINWQLSVCFSSWTQKSLLLLILMKKGNINSRLVM